MRENHHTPVRINDSRMGFCARPLSASVVPFQPYRNARIHAPAAAPFRGLPMRLFAFTYFCGHSSLLGAMLELTSKPVNGTKMSARANEYLYKGTGEIAGSGQVVKNLIVNADD